MSLNLTKPLALLAAVLILSGVVFAMSYTPQDFAAAETQRLQAEADVQHTQNMHALDEANRANANANRAVRRQYWTLALSGVALGILAVALAASGGLSAFTVAYTARAAYSQVALARKQYVEIMTRPALNELPDGATLIELPNGHAYLRDVTGRMTRIETTGANPELVQVVLAQIAAGVAREQAQTRGRVEIIE